MPSRAGHKAVILAGGGKHTALKKPKVLWPLVHRTILEHLIAGLAREGCRHIIVLLSASTDDAYFTNFLKQPDFPGLSITLLKEKTHRGTAGCLKELESFFEDDEAFLLVNGNLFLNGINLNDMIKFHRKKDALMTAFVDGNGRGEGEERSEWVNVTEDGKVHKVQRPHISGERRNGDRRKGHRLAGIYVLSDRIFRYIPNSGYMDLKEQLISRIKNEEAGTVVYNQSDEALPRLVTWQDYFNLNQALLRDPAFCISLKEEFSELSEGVWVGKDVEISPRSYILGPVVIGSGSRVDDFSQIIGPSVIGDHCHIAAGALVRESILWKNVRVPNDSRIQYHVVTEEARFEIQPGLMQDSAVTAVQDTSNAMKTSVTKNRFYKTGKRMMDLILTSAAVFLTFPLMILITCAIKLDSPGPVFFRQKRCGFGGREFGMIKFRTMVHKAESLQPQLKSKNEVDGPMFKMSEDPRVTRVGRFLRKTSLDELPQLFNVLKGEMSLVGPRPLKMEEMTFHPCWRDLRLRVMPGITGLWQIHSKHQVTFHDWIHYDSRYIQEQSIGLDMMILFKTLKIVFRR